MRGKTRGGEMVRQSRTRLALVGGAMAATIILPFRFQGFWAPAVILFTTGSHLLVWATPGRGDRCRTCKKFSLL